MLFTVSGNKYGHVILMEMPEVNAAPTPGICPKWGNGEIWSEGDEGSGKGDPYTLSLSNTSESGDYYLGVFADAVTFTGFSSELAFVEAAPQVFELVDPLRSIRMPIAGIPHC